MASVNEEEPGYPNEEEPTIIVQGTTSRKEYLYDTVWGCHNRLSNQIIWVGWISFSFLLVILIVLGVFFAEWRATEKDVLEQLTKLNQALAFLELRD